MNTRFQDDQNPVALWELHIFSAYENSSTLQNGARKQARASLSIFADDYQAPDLKAAPPVIVESSIEQLC